MSKLVFNYSTCDEKSIELNQPAFLLGNGINYTDKEFTISWTQLLIDLFPDSYKTEKESILKKNSKNEDVLDLDGISYPEIAELADLYIRADQEEKKDKTKKESIKIQICKIIDDNDLIRRENNKNGKQKVLFDFCKNNRIPILSTNYDHTILCEYKMNDFVRPKYLKNKVENLYWVFAKGKEITNKRKLPHLHYNSYFKYDGPFDMNKLDIRTQFAIWPIHGTKRYANTLCINNKDYAKKISEITRYLKSKEKMFKQTQWTGRYTWINIFLHNDLVILGLDLEENETDLRWLLVERYIYQKWLVTHKCVQERARTLYLFREERDKQGNLIEMKKGKRKFFESIGITCVRVKDDDMYQLSYLEMKNS